MKSGFVIRVNARELRALEYALSASIPHDHYEPWVSVSGKVRARLNNVEALEKKPAVKGPALRKAG